MSNFYPLVSKIIRSLVKSMLLGLNLLISINIISSIISRLLSISLFLLSNLLSFKYTILIINKIKDIALIEDLRVSLINFIIFYINL